MNFWLTKALIAPLLNGYCESGIGFRTLLSWGQGCLMILS